MTKIQGKYKDLKAIFERLKLQGKDETKTSKPLIYNCILECKDNKIFCSVLNTSCTVLGQFEFGNIKVLEAGEIPIGNLQEFSEFINKFKCEEEITIETTENEIYIIRDKPKKTAKLAMISKEHIEDSIRAVEALSKLKVSETQVIFNDLKLENKFVFDSKFMKEALDDGNISSISRIFRFNFSEKGINCLIGRTTENKIESEIALISGKGKCKVLFQQGIDNVFSNVSGNVTVFVSEDSPMFVIAEDAISKSKYVIAPVIE